MSSSPGRPLLACHVPVDVIDAMKQCAVAADRSLSAEVRVALRQHLAANGSEPLQGLAVDNSAGHGRPTDVSA